MKINTDKILVILLIGTMLLVACSQGKIGNDKTLELVYLDDDSFFPVEDSKYFAKGEIIVLNSDEDFEKGNLYKVKIDDKITASLPPIANTIEVEDLGQFSSGKITFESWENLKNFSPDKTHLIDVRSPEEFAAGHVPGAINIPLDQIEGQLMDEFDEDDILVLYCRSGNRSNQAQEILIKNDFDLVFDAGGISSYKGELEY